MSKQGICLYRVDPTGFDVLPDYRVNCAVTSRSELRESITSLRPAAIVIDLDADDGLDTLIELREFADDIPCIGLTDEHDPKVMIAAMRAGCAQLSGKPIDFDDLTMALRRAIQRANDETVSGKIFSVMGAIGGAGSSAVACYLAAGIAEVTHRQTLLIDGDLEFGGVARTWNLRPAHSIGDIATAGLVDAMMIQKAAAPVNGELSILARPTVIDQCFTIDETTMEDILDCATKSFPNVVVDLPRKLDAITGAVIQRSERLLIVLQMTLTSIDNAKRLMETLMRNGIAEDRIQFVINRYRRKHHNISVDLIEKQLGKTVLALVPGDFSSMRDAADMGTALPEAHPVRRATADLAAALYGLEAPKTSGGWLSKLGIGG